MLLRRYVVVLGGAALVVVAVTLFQAVAVSRRQHHLLESQWARAEKKWSHALRHGRHVDSIFAAGSDPLWSAVPEVDADLAAPRTAVPNPPPAVLPAATLPWAMAHASRRLAIPTAAVRSGVCRADEVVSVPVYEYWARSDTVPYDADDEAFLGRYGCADGVRFLSAYRSMQQSATCDVALFLAGEKEAEPVMQICLDTDALRPPCTVMSIGIGYNFVFDDFMHARGCTVYSLDPTMAMGRTVRKTDPLSVFEPVGIAAFDGAFDSVDMAYNGAGQRSPPYAVRTLQTLLDERNLTAINLLRMDVEGAEWKVLEQWAGTDIWSRVAQLSIELHLNLAGASEGARVSDFEAKLRVLQQIPLAPLPATRNVQDGGPLWRGHYLDPIGRAAEHGFVAKPYKARATVPPSFWKLWGFVHTEEWVEPSPPDVSALSGLDAVKAILATIHRSHCPVGLSVTAGGAAARVCTAPLANGACTMLILTAGGSGRAYDVTAKLRDAVEGEAGCRVVEARVVPGSGGGGAAAVALEDLTVRGALQRVVDMNLTALAGAAGDGHGRVDIVRLEVGYMTAALLRSWADDVPPQHAFQLSVKFPIGDDLSNARQTAQALEPWRLPYWSALGTADAGEYDRARPGTTYEVSYLAAEGGWRDHWWEQGSGSAAQGGKEFEDDGLF